MRFPDGYRAVATNRARAKVTPPRCFRCRKTASQTSLSYLGRGVYKCLQCPIEAEPDASDTPTLNLDTPALDLGAFDLPSVDTPDPSPDFSFGDGGGFSGGGAGGDF